MALQPLSLDIIMVILGLIVGNFLTAIITRYPLMLKQQWHNDCRDFLGMTPEKKSDKLTLITPKSHCLHCKNLLKWRHTIPLIGYILLSGKCAHCKRPIQLFYPLVELLSAIASVIVARKFGLSWPMVAALIFSYLIILLAFIDLHHQLLPDPLTIGTLWLGLMLNSFGFFTHLSDALWSSVVGYSFLWLLAWVFLTLRKKQGMGHGDFKMLAMVGAWLGFYSMVNTLVLAIIVSTLFSIVLVFCKQANWNKAMPFGPSLAIGAWISLLWGDFVIQLLQVS